MAMLTSERSKRDACRPASALWAMYIGATVRLRMQARRPSNEAPNLDASLCAVHVPARRKAGEACQSNVSSQ
eukprot:CAMPEP_0115869986 /NCGR_PEP_ID=MMETSP0287-20121206/22088_1 /TAXON_ID=412157 /ORGANISM="Chrysochromulina rotalis, Strain UIO044" /LENGTH=71 /DNA_ID=CAMNT_0003324683 /DNA_START=40 /DNA_END=253 /DNA_ORIENTATION=-